MKADNSASDETHLFVDIPERYMTVMISVADEGVIVDVYPLHVCKDPIASTWVLTQEALDAAPDEE